MMRTWCRDAISVSVMVLATAGPLFAQRPSCDEATVLGLEITGELIAPPQIVNQVTDELAIIRDTYPVVAGITVLPDWAPGMLLVRLTPVAWAQYLAGTYAALNALNDEYGMTVISQVTSGKLLVLASQECSNPIVLMWAYLELAGVEYAEPNGYIGDGDDITCTSPGWYTFKHGFVDCYAGCVYAHYWQFMVSDNTATLVSEYGAGLSDVEGGDHAGGLELRQNHPNPFNPATSVSFTLGESSFVSIDIYDLGGRLVCTLFAGDMDAGDHEIPWRGQDSSGNAVASGVYFCRLKAGTQVESMKMLLAD